VCSAWVGVGTLFAVLLWSLTREKISEREKNEAAYRKQEAKESGAIPEGEFISNLSGTMLTLFNERNYVSTQAIILGSIKRPTVILKDCLWFQTMTNGRVQKLVQVMIDQTFTPIAPFDSLDEGAAHLAGLKALYTAYGLQDEVERLNDTYHRQVGQGLSELGLFTSSMLLVKAERARGSLRQRNQTDTAQTVHRRRRDTTDYSGAGVQRSYSTPLAVMAAATPGKDGTNNP